MNGTLKSLEETVAGFKPQSNIIKKNKIKLGVLAAFSIGSIILYLISFIADPSTDSGSEPGKLAEKILLLPFGVFFIKYLIAFLLGLMPAFFLMDKLQALWPSVELQVGPDHLRIENSRRLWLANFFVIGVFPLLISALYDFLKLLVKSFH